jgi:hypothetical protein
MNSGHPFAAMRENLRVERLAVVIVVCSSNGWHGEFRRDFLRGIA